MFERAFAIVFNNASTKVISIGIAASIWWGVLQSRTVEVSKDVPVELVTASDIVPANELPEKVTFRLAGPKVFLRGILDRNEDPIRVNLAGSKPGWVTYRFFSDNIHLPIGVKVQAINPPSLVLKLEYVKRREVPVRVELRGAPPEAHRVTKVEIIPPSVRIKGAESRVDAVNEVVTYPVDVSNITQTLEKDATLDLSRLGVQADSAAPKIRVEIEAATANFRIKNVDIRVVSPYKAALDEKSVTVFVHADPEVLHSLDRGQIYAVADLKGKPKGKHKVSVRVVLPEHVGLAKVVPDKVSVTLK